MIHPISRMEIAPTTGSCDMNERKIFAMHRRFGTCGVLRCKTCSHLVRHEYNRNYYKCELYGESSSEATDWKVSYQACGMYNVPQNMETYVPVIEQIKHLPRIEPPIDGQIRLEM